MQAQSSESQPVDQVEVTKVTGTVQKVDTDKRKMTMKLDNGKRTTLKVDKRVKDLDQFKPGDRVQLSYTEEIIAMADRSDEGAAALAKYGAIAVEPEGDNPALVKVDTTQIRGKIVSVDPKKRRLTFEDPDGKKRTMTLSHRIKDLDQFKPGQTINMAITDEMVVEAVHS
jgi:Cu/Ag efflux protein CusF